jgi:hypothetical protein
VTGCHLTADEDAPFEKSKKGHPLVIGNTAKLGESLRLFAAKLAITRLRFIIAPERSDEESLFILRLFLPLILCRVFVLLSFCYVLL